MIAEAQLDPNTQARATVTSCLQDRYRGGAIMMSMGSLGHYMQEMSSAGFAIRDFLHEGNGPIWDSAFTRGPAPLVEWVIVEEVAEGGDVIVQRNRAFPRLLADFERVCEGGHIAVYQRRSRRDTAIKKSGDRGDLVICDRDLKVAPFFRSLDHQIVRSPGFFLRR